MSSKDLSLDLVDKLEMLKKNGVDFLLICMEPGKNVDRSDVWYELNNPDSPANLLESCLSLFTNLYDKDDLVDLLFEYCQHLEELEEEPERPAFLNNPPPQKKKRKKNPPNSPNNGNSNVGPQI